MNTETPTHAGFIVKIFDKDLYLICHSTQNPDRLYVGQTWTITKGAIEKGESPFQAAVREMKEETDIEFTLDYFSYCTEDFKTLQFNGKTVRVFTFVVPDDYLSLPLTCNGSIERGIRIGLKEMDGYMWCSKKVAYELVFPSQKELFV